METKTKKVVNIDAKFPVILGNMKIFGTVLNLELPVGDIQQCILKRALVDEVLSNGRTVRLSLSNFNLNNDVVEVTKPTPQKEVKKIEEKEIIAPKEELVINPIFAEEPVEEVVEEPTVVAEEELIEPSNKNSNYNKSNNNKRYK